MQDPPNGPAEDEQSPLPGQNLGLDWLSPVSSVSKHAQFIRSVDWAATKIGLPSQWPQQLRQMFDLALADPVPAAVMWGDDLTMVYNESFVEFAGLKHPALMGKSPRTEYAEVWEPMFQPIVDRGHRTGQSTRHENVGLFLRRHGYLEELYVTYTFVPIVGPEKTVVGFYHTALETTAEVLNERRTRALLSLGDYTAYSRTMADYWDNMIKAFETLRDDIPYLVAYSFGEVDDHSTSSGMSSSTDARVMSTCSVAGLTGCQVSQVPIMLELADEEDALISHARTALKTGEIVLLESTHTRLPRWLFTADESRKYPEPCTHAVIVPISPTGANDSHGHSSIGFAIVGINPRLKYDRSYTQFIQLCARQMASSAASIMMFVEEVRRQKLLAQRLLESSREAKELEKKFSRFSQLSNVAVWIAAPDGRFLQANEAWCQQTGIKWSGEMTQHSWLMSLTESSRPLAEASWTAIVTGRVPATFECQLQSHWSSHDDKTGQEVHGDRWILCTAFPELAEDGSLKSVWGCNTDISAQKYAEGLKEQRLADVLEAKRASESFIDITSHEMRNPLSAILQCADDIFTTTREVLSQEKPTNVSLGYETIESIADSAATIMTCAQHQKRIIDDILTLSKLDANLLTIHRAPTDPITTAQHALKIHQREFENADIGYELCIDPAYTSLSPGTVLLDQGRVIQVLINLITNAIKFTQPQAHRRVSLRLGASLDDPALSDKDVDYLTVKESRPSKTPDSQARDKQELFLTFSVIDSGCGLTAKEKEKLFGRFSQASPKTHTKYGGSGLGLFICKQLTELHGGRIGVCSTPGRGSCFRFYVQVRRTKVDLELRTQQKRSADSMPAAATTRRKPSPAANPEGPSGKQDVPHHARLELYGSAPTEAPPPMHVLLVEDNVINQKVMASQLRKARCTVHIANHGEEALEVMARSALARGAAAAGAGEDAVQLDILLMDLEMPVMDGLTCVARIRELEASGLLTGRVPVIAVTGNARSQHVDEALATGMDDVITKPFRVPDLIPIMRALVNKAGK